MIRCCKTIAAYGAKIGGVDKLVTHLSNTGKYVLHYKNFQMYLSLGMKLIRAHRILKFKPSDWLKKYNDFKQVKKCY